jgi:transglutaminase-like putative cysteine protease
VDELLEEPQEIRDRQIVPQQWDAWCPYPHNRLILLQKLRGNASRLQQPRSSVMLAPSEIARMSQNLQRFLNRVLLLVSFLNLVVRLNAQGTNLAFAPPAGWVREVDWAATNWARNEKSEGTRYLLYELQERPKRAEQFLRVISLMENEAGVQDSGSLRFTFDPSFQELLLHRLVVHRAGKALDRLDRSKVRVIQPEPDLDGHILTGEQAALVFVEDLRVGDALEYAYTIRGANPVLAGHYANRFRVQSRSPVDRQQYRVIWDSPTPLQLRSHLVGTEPVIIRQPGSFEYTWNFTNLTEIPYEDFRPPSFEPYPYVELTDFADWSSVVNWAVPLYAPGTNRVPAELRDLIARWKSSVATDEERARLALQFVQDDLRYTGIELGPDSYRPADPIETFQKRFGDCKGKVALLCFLLRELNIKAQPALVNTYAGEALGNRLPSPFAFNHVIVKLELDGKTTWADPTSSHQGGTLWDRYVPPYGKALVLRAGNRTLDDIPRARADIGSQQKVFSTITIKDYETPVAFTVRTEYRGSSADSMREDVARTDPDKLAEQYLNFYARFYASIKTNQPLRISDDRLQNLLTVEESYLITNLWEFNEKDKLWKAIFYADNLYNALTEPNTRLRKSPLALDYPFQRQQEITVHLPDADWNIPDSEKTVDHDAFAFKYQCKLDRSTVRFNYDCRTKLATLPADLVPGYLAKLDEMNGLLDDTLRRPNDKLENVLARINWLMIVVVAFGLCGTAVGSVWYWHRTGGPPPLPAGPPAIASPEDHRLTGLGGWLVLIGLGLCVAPLIRLVTVGQHWEGYFSVQVWQVVAMPKGASYQPLYGPLLIFELLGNTVLLGLNLLALCLFFSKRRAFPRIYITFILFNALFLILDDTGSAQLLSRQATATVSSYRDSARATFYAVIWTAYMLRSRRVRLTFVK